MIAILGIAGLEGKETGLPKQESRDALIYPE
jgi:hypothetical protein